MLKYEPKPIWLPIWALSQQMNAECSENVLRHDGTVRQNLVDDRIWAVLEGKERPGARKAPELWLRQRVLFEGDRGCQECG